MNDTKPATGDDVRSWITRHYPVGSVTLSRAASTLDTQAAELAVHAARKSCTRDLEELERRYASATSEGDRAEFAAIAFDALEQLHAAEAELARLRAPVGDEAEEAARELEYLGTLQPALPDQLRAAWRQLTDALAEAEATNQKLWLRVVPVTPHKWERSLKYYREGNTGEMLWRNGEWECTLSDGDGLCLGRGTGSTPTKAIAAAQTETEEGAPDE